MQYRVKSQLYSDAEAQQKGAKQILDDCTWSSCAAAVSWASGYTVDYSAADGVAAMKKVTGRKDVQGKSDNGGSLAEAAKVIAHLGGKARYAKSWEDAVAAAKGGAALQIWVQQGPAFYPAGVKISAWHDRWFKWWSKKDPAHLKAGYGHMTSAGYDDVDGWQWACPTRDEKVAAEKYGVPVTEAQLRQIANSKFKAKKAGVDYKCILIVTHPGKVAAPKPQDNPTPVPAPVTAPVVKAAPVVAPAPTPAPAPRIAVEAPRSHAEPRKVAQATKTPPDAVQAQLDQIDKADWGAIAADGLAVLNAAAAATGKEKGMNRIFAGLKYIAANTQIDEIALDFVKTFLTVSISVALGLGIPLLDIQGGDFRTIISAGLASGLGIVVKALDRDNSAYGLTKKN
jgi:hypothetical protein